MRGTSLRPGDLARGRRGGKGWEMAATHHTQPRRRAGRRRSLCVRHTRPAGARHSMGGTATAAGEGRRRSAGSIRRAAQLAPGAAPRQLTRRRNRGCSDGDPALLAARHPPGGLAAAIGAVARATQRCSRPPASSLLPVFGAPRAGYISGRHAHLGRSAGLVGRLPHPLRSFVPPTLAPTSLAVHLRLLRQGQRDAQGCGHLVLQVVQEDPERRRVPAGVSTPGCSEGVAAQ